MGGPAKFENSWKWTERLQEELPKQGQGFAGVLLGHILLYQYY
jgi:hypothetical protein